MGSFTVCIKFYAISFKIGCTFGGFIDRTMEQISVFFSLRSSWRKENIFGQCAKVCMYVSFSEIISMHSSSSSIEHHSVAPALEWAM